MAELLTPIMQKSSLRSIQSENIKLNTFYVNNNKVGIQHWIQNGVGTSRVK